jgi:hypothetical protein
MSVLPSDIVAYGSADMPEADGVTIGGGPDLTRRIAFYDVTPAGTCDVVSSATADTATKITVYGRDPTGAIQDYTATLNGQTPVTGAQTFERLLYAALSGATSNGPVANPGGTAAVGDVALGAHDCVLPSGSLMTDTTYHTCQTGSANHSGVTPALMHLQSGDGANVAVGQIIWTRGGTGPNQIRQIIATNGYGTDVVAVSRDWATLPDGTTEYKILQGMMFDVQNTAGSGSTPVTAVIRCFSTAAADVPSGSVRTYYEKVFIINNNTATALTGAQIEITSETPTLPSGAALDLALCTALDDTNTTTNRQTAPSAGAGSFVTQPALVSVPGSGNLPPGAAPNTAGAQGVWLRLTLQPGTAAYKGAADLRAQGTTT